MLVAAGCAAFGTGHGSRRRRYACALFFVLHIPPPAEIYTLSLHDALPIFGGRRLLLKRFGEFSLPLGEPTSQIGRLNSDRKSTRLNSSHSQISYAVFCLKKKSAGPQKAERRRGGRRRPGNVRASGRRRGGA